jgi:hypothetical protein
MLDTKCVQKCVDREVVEIMSKVCEKLSQARVNLGNLLKDQPEDYFKFREEIFDCEELMAKYCDCAPIRLIAGQVDDIMSNLRSN